MNRLGDLALLLGVLCGDSRKTGRTTYARLVPSRCVLWLWSGKGFDELGHGGGTAKKNACGVLSPEVWSGSSPP